MPIACGRGTRGRLGTPLLLAALIVYGLGFKATDVRPARLVTGLPGVMPYLRALTEPELMTHPTQDVRGTVPFQVPCIDPLPAPSVSPSKQPSVTVGVPCANVGDSIEIRGEGYVASSQGELWWQNPIGDLQQVIQDGQQVKFVTDEEGKFVATFKVPLAVPLTQLPEEGETQTHVIIVEQHIALRRLGADPDLEPGARKDRRDGGHGLHRHRAGHDLGHPDQLPGCPQPDERQPRPRAAIYFVVRALLNIVRSIETLMWAIVFVVWVGVGPFGGMLALFLHTIAALGKLYSEAIECIDPGPIEALKATGANGLQVIVYAVLPQIVPTFLSFTLYRWDINVRMSTVIGLISDAGLGFLLIQWIRLNNLRAMATSIIAIVLVVAILDYTSAWLRERIIAGTPVARRASPLRRGVVTGLVLALFAAAFAWSWGVARIRLFDLVEGTPDGLRMLGDFAVPKLFTRPTEEHTVGVTLPVPCGSGEQEAAQAGGARVDLSLTCGEVGDPLVIRGHDLPANADVSVRWVLSDGAFLRIKQDCCTTDGTGSLTLETKVSPLMVVDAATGRAEPGRVEIVWKEIVGGPRLSDEFKEVVDLSLVTLLMALLATTLGIDLCHPLELLRRPQHHGQGPHRPGRLLCVSHHLQPMALGRADDPGRDLRGVGRARPFCRRAGPGPQQHPQPGQALFRDDRGDRHRARSRRSPPPARTACRRSCMPSCRSWCPSSWPSSSTSGTSTSACPPSSATWEAEASASCSARTCSSTNTTRPAWPCGRSWSWSGRWTMPAPARASG